MLKMGYKLPMGLCIKTILKNDTFFSIIIKSVRHFLGSVGVRGSVRGPFFTRHPPCVGWSKLDFIKRT